MLIYYIEFYLKTHLLLVNLVSISFMLSCWSFGGKYYKGGLLWCGTLCVLVASAAFVFIIEE
jgi:hypothetical protein